MKIKTRRWSGGKREGETRNEHEDGGEGSENKSEPVVSAVDLE